MPTKTKDSKGKRLLYQKLPVAARKRSQPRKKATKTAKARKAKAPGDRRQKDPPWVYRVSGIRVVSVPFVDPGVAASVLQWVTEQKQNRRAAA